MYDIESFVVCNSLMSLDITKYPRSHSLSERIQQVLGSFPSIHSISVVYSHFPFYLFFLVKTKLTSRRRKPSAEISSRSISTSQVLGMLTLGCLLRRHHIPAPAPRSKGMPTFLNALHYILSITNNNT